MLAAIKKAFNSQCLIFTFGLILFLGAAVLGWQKLKYGFSFLDEGWHMTESWRLSAGDHFLKDKFAGADMLYTLINASIFKLYPNISLLGFRRLQYILTICSLLIFSISLAKVSGKFWYQPFVFSLFAFTGLSPAGWNSNLNYYTYPHLFLTLYLSFFLLGLSKKKRKIRKLLFIASGLCIWLVSFTLLHLSVFILAPILTYVVLNRSKFEYFTFDRRDLFYVLIPFLLCWGVFIGIYNKPYILAVLKTISFRLAVPVYAPEGLANINWEALKHMGVCFVFALGYLFTLRVRRYLLKFAILAGISLLMFFVIDTSLFGLIAPYALWFSRPMWLCGLLVSFFVLFSGGIVKKYFNSQGLDLADELFTILLIPCVFLGLTSAVFSGGMGILNILHTSIPAAAGITIVIIYRRQMRMRSYGAKMIAVIALLLPFYYTTAWSDWRFTYFDVFPEQANSSIDKGFCRGIRTNAIYEKLYKWIRMNTERYTEKDDFIISYVLSPMVHMIAKRRPALGDTYITFMAGSFKYYEELVRQMEKRGRRPKMAFVFENMPGLYPTSLKNSEFKWTGKQFHFPSRDPISRYIVENMRLLKELKIKEGNTVRCFLNTKMIHMTEVKEIDHIQEALSLSPDNASLHYKLGNLYKKAGRLDEAIVQYEKAVAIDPGFSEAWNSMAVSYLMKNQPEKAISSFKKVIEFGPDSVGAYYNIACIYARKNKKDNAIRWLMEAINRGYDNWGLIKTDKDLENIRGTSAYQEIMAGK